MSKPFTSDQLRVRRIALCYLLKGSMGAPAKHNPNDCQRKRSRKYLGWYVVLTMLAILLAYLDWIYYGWNQF